LRVGSGDVVKHRTHSNNTNSASHNSAAYNTGASLNRSRTDYSNDISAESESLFLKLARN